MLGRIRGVTRMGVVTKAVGYLDGYLLMERLLIRLGWSLLHRGRLDVCHRHRLLRTWLMHGDRNGSVLLEGRL